jgi:hypothetical protein
VGTQVDDCEVELVCFANRDLYQSTTGEAALVGRSSLRSGTIHNCACF